MWAAVLLLAVAVNFEPTRIGLVAYLLGRPRPDLLLFSFLCGMLGMTASAGLLVLFVLQHGPLEALDGNGAKVQIAVGVLAVLVAALLATNISVRRSAGSAAAGTGEPALPGNLAKLSTRARTLLMTGSPWLTGAIGIGLGLPSLDYLAMLAVIGASGASPGIQVAALVTFLVVAHAVVEAPLAGYLLAPEKTRMMVGALYAWIRTRRRRDFAALLGIVGCVLIAIGAHRL